MNIYDQKRRNAVYAYCDAENLQVVERCIQLEDFIRDSRDMEVIDRAARCEQAERERDEARDLLSQWRECWNDNLDASGDLLDQTNEAIDAARGEGETDA